MKASAFDAPLKMEARQGLYPSRLEGRAEVSSIAGTGGKKFEYEFRGRFGPIPAPSYVIGKSCSEIVAAIKAAPASTPLVSLTRSSTISCLWSGSSQLREPIRSLAVQFPTGDAILAISTSERGPLALTLSGAGLLGLRLALCKRIGLDRPQQTTSMQSVKKK